VEHKTLGRYRILGELGRGAVSAVFRAVDPTVEREVAVRTLLPTLPAEVLAAARERFLREARAAARLNHPNIVTIFEVGEHDGVAYVAMELVAGRSLQQILRDPARLPFDTAADLAAQLADALEHAHGQSMTHRGVKPANVIVAPSGRCKLTDFGFADVAGAAASQTGGAGGLPRYLSPEQVLGYKVDARSDLFSLGTVLYEMLARRTPFDREGEANLFLLMNRIAAEAHPAPRAIDAAIPAALEKIVNRALAKKPEERYQRAAEMAGDLRNWRGAGQPAAQPAAPARLAAPASLADSLLGDLDEFSKTFDMEAQELARRVEEEKRKKEDAQRRAAAAAAAEAEAAKRAREAKEREAAAPAKRGAALELLRKQATAAGPREDPAVTRAKAITALNQSMRETDRYLAEFIFAVKTQHPAAARPYPFLHLGALPRTVLSEGWIDSRPRRIEGVDYLDYVVMRYRVNPDPPAKQMLYRDELAHFEQYLKSMSAVYELQPTAKNDFGQVMKAVFTITGGPKCEVVMRADYDNYAVRIDLDNVRQPGRRQGRIALAEFGDLADELARYILGADDDFERRLAPVKQA
jgi:serine/threonine-protein kinase